jgi:hypothetical protein
MIREKLSFYFVYSMKLYLISIEIVYFQFKLSAYRCVDSKAENIYQIQSAVIIIPMGLLIASLNNTVMYHTIASIDVMT